MYQGDDNIKEAIIMASPVTIFAIKTADCYQFGWPASYRLEEPHSLSREWITKAEYELPDGYEVAENAVGEPTIYDAKGNRCPLVSGRKALGGDDFPVLVIGTVDEPAREPITLKKIRDLDW